MLIRNPFPSTEREIIEHMNRDHGRALIHYCGLMDRPTVQNVVMSGIDSEGFDLLAEGRKLRIDFDSPIGTVEEARAALVRLSRM
jgi:putative heme iron utilization protein